VHRPPFFSIRLQIKLGSKRSPNFPGGNQGRAGVRSTCWHCGNIAAGAKHARRRPPNFRPEIATAPVPAKFRAITGAALPMNEDAINKAWPNAAPANPNSTASPRPSKTSPQLPEVLAVHSTMQLPSGQSEFHQRLPYAGVAFRNLILSPAWTMQHPPGPILRSSGMAFCPRREIFILKDD